MEEKYIMGVPGGVRAPMSLGKVTFEQKPDRGKEQVKCSQWRKEQLQSEIMCENTL